MKNEEDTDVMLVSFNGTTVTAESISALAEQGTLELLDLITTQEQFNAAGLKDRTIALYRLWIEHSASPLAYIACFNLGVAFTETGKHAQAEEMYRKALGQNPQLIQARLNLGNALESQRRDDEALEQLRIALGTKDIDQPENRPLKIHAMNNLARLLDAKGKFPEALAVYADSFKLDSTQQDVPAHLVELARKMCQPPASPPQKSQTKADRKKENQRRAAETKKQRAESRPAPPQFHGTPAAPQPQSLGTDLSYIEQPTAAADFSRPKIGSDHRYVIVAPPFQHNSAGIRVLYELQKWLVRAGLDAIVCTWFNGYPVDQFADDVVIYPEVAPGNLLNARRVIRYILNVPGKLGHGDKQYDKNEVLVAYNKELAHYANGKMLQVPVVEPFFRRDGTPKTANAFYVGKGRNLNLHPADCIPITKTFPATRREVAQLLRSVKTLYMYDDFSMIGYEAKLCGCEVKLIRADGTLTEYELSRFPSMEEFMAQLHDFIEMTKLL